jgi:uncharacterized membrane protein
MSVIDTTMRTTHLLFGAVWVGSVLFVTLSVLPLARDGDLNAAPVESVLGRLTTVSRTSALLLFLTGGHLAGTGYTVDSLTGSTRGHLVLGMVALWLVLAALVEVGAARATDGLKQKKVRSPARDALPFFRGASLAGVGLLVTAGLLAV